MNINFYSLWFNPTGNQTRVYRFSCRRSIHATIDRLNLVMFAFLMFFIVVELNDAFWLQLTLLNLF